MYTSIVFVLLLLLLLLLPAIVQAIFYRAFQRIPTNRWYECFTVLIKYVCYIFMLSPILLASTEMRCYLKLSTKWCKRKKRGKIGNSKLESISLNLSINNFYVFQLVSEASVLSDLFSVFSVMDSMCSLFSSNSMFSSSDSSLFMYAWVWYSYSKSSFMRPVFSS